MRSPPSSSGSSCQPKDRAICAKLVRRLFQREEDSRLAASSPLEEELQRQQRLAGARPTLDDRRARARQAAAEHLVEPVHPRRDALRGRSRVGRDGLGALHSREEPQPLGADLQEVTTRHVPRPAELEDLDLADGGQLFTAVDEPDDAVGDGELGEGRDLGFPCTRRRRGSALPTSTCGRPDRRRTSARRPNRPGCPGWP